MPVLDLAEDLNALPLTAGIANPKSSIKQLASSRVFPPTHDTIACTNQILLAADFTKEPGVVLDYTTIDSDQTDFTFQSGETYYLSGFVQFSGATTINAGTVLKFLDDGTVGGSANLACNGSISWNTTADRPAVFTSEHDDSVGVTLPTSNRQPSQSIETTYLTVTSATNVFQHCRFKYAWVGINGGIEFDDCHFIQCGWGIMPAVTSPVVKNSLVVGCDGLTDDSATCYHVTFDACDCAVRVYGDFINCVFSRLNQISYGEESWGAHNGYYDSPYCDDMYPVTSLSDPFYNAGGYYLATNSAYRNVGMTNINPDLLAELQTMTTYAPQDGGYPDTNTPDLGYHYPVNEDSDYDGLPDWWEWKYFGGYAVSGTNLDFANSSRTFSKDYSNSITPTVFQYDSLTSSNVYVNGGQQMVQARVVGWPYYVATLVDSTDASNAVWNVYVSSNLTVNLGLTEGWHDAWAGLRGHGDSLDESLWQGKRFKLDYTPPQIVITNLPGLTVAVPMIQIQGLVNEALSRLTYDVSNATGIFTNLTGYTTEVFYDTNQLAFTTNSFQCYDIALTTNGVNHISIHATDLAGNITTTNFNVTVDYANATTPTTALTWPPGGTVVGGSNFVLQASVSDPTATVTVSIVDTNGQTNVVMGTVSRNGQILLNQIPLGNGVNSVTVTTTGASGLSSTNTLTLTGNNVGLMMNPLLPSQQNQPSVSVGGSVGDPSYTVTINGVTAAVATNGTWTAEGVTVNPTGTATFDIEVKDGAGNLVAEQKAIQYQPALATLASFEWTGESHGHSFGRNEGSSEIDCSNDDWWVYQANYLAGVGGDEHYRATRWDHVCGHPVTIDGYDDVYSSDEPIADNAGYVETMQSYPDGVGLWTEYDHERSQVVITPSGQPVAAGATKTYLVRAAAYWTGLVANYWRNVPLPPEWLQIKGKPLINTGVEKTTTSYFDGFKGTVWGETLVQAQAEATVDITPEATQVYGNWWEYYFDVQASEVNLQLAVDNNRDGQITFDDNDVPTQTKPFRFWINDSKETGDIVSSAEDQIPGSSPPNYSWNHVQGQNDYVNFFPVALKLADVLQQCPLTNGYEFRLSQADNAVKFLYTRLASDRSFEYLTNSTSSEDYGEIANYYPSISQDSSGAISYATLTNADLVRASATGAKLNTNWLAQVQTNGGIGIILMEGCAETTQPLMLEIWHNGQKLGGVPLYLNISGVEQMFRHLNLRDGADAPSSLPGPAYSGDTGVASHMGNPGNFPDELLDDKWLIFTHGYNVSAQSSRGWEAEMFKRFYWSGSKAKFIGVDWLGNPVGANFLSYYSAEYGIADYYLAVMNAFATAPVLATKLNALSGSKTIVGHSLGCELTAFALNDFGLQVNHACLVDAAVAQECFDGDADDNLTAMRPSAWENYPEELWAAHWHERFGVNDARSTLTWRNRFTNALSNSDVYSFYSSTEDVLGEYDGEATSAIVENSFAVLGNFSTSPLGNYAWVIQEKTKGNIAGVAGVTIQGSDYGGWGFNVWDGYLTNYPKWYVSRVDIGDRRVKTPTEIGTVTQDLLDGSKYNPLFKNGWGWYDPLWPENAYVNVDTAKYTGPSWIQGLFTTTGGGTLAAQPDKNAQLLAQAIPALSLPVGSKLTTAFDNQNYNMPAQFVNGTHWPADRGIVLSSGVPNWHHSDISQVAYPYVYKLFNQLVLISNQ